MTLAAAIALVALGCSAGPNAPSTPPARVHSTTARVIVLGGGAVQWCRGETCQTLHGPRGSELAAAALSPDETRLVVGWTKPDVASELERLRLYDRSGGAACDLGVELDRDLTLAWATRADGTSWPMPRSGGRTELYDAACEYVASDSVSLVVDGTVASIDGTARRWRVEPSAALAIEGAPRYRIAGEAVVSQPFVCDVQARVCRPLTFAEPIEFWDAELAPDQDVWLVRAGVDRGHELVLVDSASGDERAREDVQHNADIRWGFGSVVVASSFSLGCDCGATWVLRAGHPTTRLEVSSLSPSGELLVEYPADRRATTAAVTLWRLPELEAMARVQVGPVPACSLVRWAGERVTLSCVTDFGRHPITLAARP